MAAKKSVPTIAEVVAAYRLIADAIEAGVFTGSTSADAGADQYDREDVEGRPIRDIRALAVELGLDEQKVKSGILDEMESKGLFADSAEEDDEDDEEYEDEEEDDEDGDEDEDDEEEDDEEEEDEGGYDREELSNMSLAALKKLAKEEGHDASVYRKMDQDALIDLLAEDEDDEDDEEEEEEIDEDTLKAMDLGQLKKVAAELELKVPVAVAKNKAKLVNFILENAGEEDDE